MSLYPLTHSQVLCVKCFEQNDEISSGVNNLVRNGGFENTDCTPNWLGGSYCPNSDLYNCDIDNWLCTDGGAQSYPIIFDSTLALIPEGQYAAYFGNGNAFTCSDNWGDFSCETFHECTVTGFQPGYPKSLPGYGEQTGVSLEQTVSGLTVGHTYVLEFWAGGEPLQGLLPGEGIFAVDIGFGKIYLTCKPTDKDHFPLGTVYLIEFNASSTSHTIKFTNWGHICGDCTELVVDDVKLYTVEELSASVTPCITATSEQQVKVNFEINPNPFDSELHIQSNLTSKIKFSLYNCLSNKVMDQDFSRSTTLNTSRLEGGIYFYEFRSKNGLIKSGKIVKK
jgi:hypothetical protein